MHRWFTLSPDSTEVLGPNLPGARAFSVWLKTLFKKKSQCVFKSPADVVRAVTPY